MKTVTIRTGERTKAFITKTGRNGNKFYSNISVKAAKQLIRNLKPSWEGENFKTYKIS